VHDGLRPPEHVQTIARQILESQFEVIESGHYIPVQMPEKAVELLKGLLNRATF